MWRIYYLTRGLEHIDSQLQASWRGGLFPWTLTFRFLSVFTLCACSSHHPVVCSFDTIYHPTDFTVMNETLLDFMLYLLYGQKKTTQKNRAKTLQM